MLFQKYTIMQNGCGEFAVRLTFFGKIMESFRSTYEDYILLHLDKFSSYGMALSAMEELKRNENLITKQNTWFRLKS